MATDIDIAALTQKWRHSHEEDTGDRMVFRPESYAFPPSRGRRSFELRAGGRVINQRPGADDRPEESSGSWHLRDDGKLELRTPGAQSPTVFTIESVTPEKLIVKKAP